METDTPLPSEQRLKQMVQMHNFKHTYTHIP
jgi:hypothetical protein